MVRLDLSDVVSLDIETTGTTEDLSLSWWARPTLTVAGVYSSLEDEYHVFTHNNLDGLFPILDRASLIIGWNIYGFDFKVLKLYHDMKRYYAKAFDLMNKLLKQTHQLLALDNVSRATLGIGKLTKYRWAGKGAEELWKGGYFNELVQYNKRDTMLPYQLLLFALNYSYLVYTDKLATRREVNVRWA